MKLLSVRSLLVVAALIAASGAPSALAQTLNVITAGDQNMVDYVNNYLGPKFEKLNPGVKVRAVGTGPGDSGSQKIYEKLSAQQKAGSAAWDIDVAVVHQRGAATMVNEKLLMPYRNVTVFYGHIHQEHHYKTAHIEHHAAKGLMFPLPAPGSQPRP